MTTKLWIYIFTFIGTIVNMILLTYKHIPEEFYFNYYVFVGAVFITMSNWYKRTGWRYFWRGAACVVFIDLLRELYDKDIAKIFGEYAPFWLLAIALVVVHRNYIESKDLHRKQLLRYSEAVLHLMGLYNKCFGKYKRVDNYTIDFVLMFNEIEKCQKKLKQEILASNFISDFSLEELFVEIKRRMLSKTKERSSIYEDVPFKNFSQCREMKLAEEVACCNYIFMRLINGSEEECKSEKLSTIIKNLESVLADLKKKYQQRDLYRYFLIHRK